MSTSGIDFSLHSAGSNLVSIFVVRENLANQKGLWFSGIMLL